MRYTVGLTGGIGSGKSTVAARFAALGVAVVDADEVAHRLTAPGGAAIDAIRAAFGKAFISADGALDRARMRAHVFADPDERRRLEGILHPMVHAEQRAFVARARRAGRRAVVLDVPLLFEVGWDRDVDLIVVVSAPRAVQIHRVRLRRKMSPADVAAVIARQMPDAEKRRRADVVVRTGLSRHYALRALNRFIQGLRA